MHRDSCSPNNSFTLSGLSIVKILACAGTAAAQWARILTCMRPGQTGGVSGVSASHQTANTFGDDPLICIPDLPGYRLPTHPILAESDPKPGVW